MGLKSLEKLNIIVIWCLKFVLFLYIKEEDLRKDKYVRCMNIKAPVYIYVCFSEAVGEV